jgi:hypothetical protein
VQTRKISRAKSRESRQNQVMYGQITKKASEHVHGKIYKRVLINDDLVQWIRWFRSPPIYRWRLSNFRRFGASAAFKIVIPPFTRSRSSDMWPTLTNRLSGSPKATVDSANGTKMMVVLPAVHQPLSSFANLPSRTSMTCLLPFPLHTRLLEDW